MTASPPRTILITGTSSGFGRLTALTLARAGHRVFASMRAVDHNNRAAADALRAAAAADALDLHVIELDVTSDASVHAAVATVVREAGGLDVVVNNAGQVYRGLTEAFTSEDITRQLDVNVTGVARVTNTALPYLRERRGLVVNLSSVVGRLVVPTFGVYSATKYAVEALSESYRYELAPVGVDVAIVEPSAYPTDIFGKSSEPAGAAVVGDAYGEAADRFAALLEGFESSEEDPQEVADAILGLVEAPAGRRPLRTIVGPDFGVARVNAATEPVQRELLEALGVGDLEPSGARPAAAS